MLRIRKDDTVTVITGKDKGKKGKVIAVLPVDNRVLVEGVNFVKKHRRKTQQDQQGGVIQKEMPLHLSNVMLFCKRCNCGVRIGASILKDGTKVRLCRSCKEVI